MKKKDDITAEHQRFLDEIMIEEDLLPELQPYADGSMLRHQLLITSIYPGRCRPINSLYKQKKRRFEEALRKGNYVEALWIVEKPYRLDYFEETQDKLTDAQYWKELGLAYTDQEFHKPAQLRRLFLNPRPQRELLMDEEERQHLASLPDRFEIYRGYAQTPNGWAWSLSRDKAIWFAKRFAEVKGTTPRLATGTVAKPQVIAYFKGRDEDEIVVDPRRVKNVQKEELSLGRRRK